MSDGHVELMNWLRSSFTRPQQTEAKISYSLRQNMSPSGDSIRGNEYVVEDPDWVEPERLGLLPEAKQYTRYSSQCRCRRHHGRFLRKATDS